MKTIKTVAGTFMALLILICFTRNAYSWGATTHAYIANSLIEDYEFISDVLYGANGPDIFNYAFQYPGLYSLLHQNCLSVWENAESNAELAYGYGFATHCDNSSGEYFDGADFTAHHAGITYGKKEGYVIKKTKILKNILEPAFRRIGIPNEIGLLIAHPLVEFGIDLLVARLNHDIGDLVMTSAIGRSTDVPDLLVRTYSGNIEASTIRTAEEQFRQSTIAYGYVLTQDEQTAIALITGQMIALSDAFLKAYNITLPDGADVAPLISLGIVKSIEICADSFEAELEATIEQVKENLATQDISY